MRRCADLVDCGYDNRDSELFCRACALPLLGTALAGRYVVEALVSKGGYAAVFRGVDRNLSRHVAIKVLLPSRTTPVEHDHFLREARIAATLDHPNIVPILDYGKDGPSVFLVMPLYTAGSLRTRLAQVNGPLPAQETLHNFTQLANALHYAHTRPRPVIHRDIKPENILVHQEDHRLVITDFGIARLLEPGARFGQTVTVRGTVGYMAPEQTSGIVDPRSDQYGCAVVLYEMLTGYHPVDPASGSVPPVSALNPELPATLDLVLQHALATHPEDRYLDMLEFMRAFEVACRPSAKMRIPALKQHTPAEVRVVPTVRGSTGVSLPVTPMGTSKQSSVRNQPLISTGSVREKCREGDQLLRKQHYSQALQVFEEVLRLDPNNFYAWNGKGTALYNQGNYRKAYEAYQRATEIDPNNAVVWVSAGLVLNRLERHQQALVHFERALSINPLHVAAWNGKADTQLDLNMPEEALASYEQALAYDPKSFQAWNGLGNARSCLRDFAGAVEAYTQALLVNSRSAVAWGNKAEALIHLGHNRAALDALHEATEMDKGYTRAWLLKADIYDALGNVQEAQKARRRARSWGMKSF
ncbi:tetratricopeptide repeat protein [Ktedonosporobacter rubrisoli]|uniref:non-specific serine/threonine protein kinase n=1 Tax=Ktedonosporobacter rubrisoli TaxID=2509675 RepID=A0A4P6K1S2_KTERU|nr:serine/threonine-protein kinase [Ktedonosporobacter rubrisoli]QBD81783.1 tetratricopeptide repeat protein [Ktedonosporobacter rubrisoli]